MNPSGWFASAWRKDSVRLTLFAFVIFAAGYLLFYGKLASISGSWAYVMRTSDDSLYWASLKGYLETPSSEGNPFYFEHRGQGHAIPYPTLLVMSWFCRLFGVQPLFFFPIWAIGMPLLLWWSFFWCLTRLWGYPEKPGAALTLLLFLSTLFLQDISNNILLRFPHPGDGLWLLFFWISLVFHGKVGSTHTALLCALAFAVFWIHPYLAFLGALVTGLEMLWQFAVTRDRKQGLRLLAACGSVLTAALLYAWYVKTGMPPAGEGLRQFTANAPIPIRHIEWVSFYLYGTALAAVFLVRFLLKTKLTLLDRFLLFILAAEWICGNIQLVLPDKMLVGYHRHNFAEELGHHRYSYLLIELAVVTGWLWEKIPGLLQNSIFKKLQAVLVILLIGAGGAVLISGKWSFLRYAPNINPKFSLANPQVILGLMPFLFLLIWSLVRFQAWRRLITKPAVVAGILILMTAIGYPMLAAQSYAPGHHNYIFRDFPFGGAYQWLKDHARRHEVVLTAPPSRLDIEYLTHYTEMKSYIHPFGNLYDTGSQEEGQEHTYRFLFYYHLLVDNLKDFTFRDADTMEEKLTRLRLDYVLVERSSPFLPHILEHLEGYARTVYQDNRCILLQIKLPNKQA